MSWVLIAVVVIALVIFAKATGFRYGKTMTNLIGGVLGFLTITFVWVMIQSGHSSTLDSYSGFVSGVRFYAIWLSTLFTTGAAITGNAIESLAHNVTNISR